MAKLIIDIKSRARCGRFVGQFPAHKPGVWDEINKNIKELE